MSQFDVIVVGGGLAGAALACALRETRLRIALVETRPPRRPDGWDPRIYAISPTNAAFLERLGAWKHLDPERLAPILAMQVFGDAGGRIDFSAYEAGVSELAWIVEASSMACEFWEGLKRQSNLTLFCPASPSGLRLGDEAARLTLDDGRVLEAALIVGADGRASWVRAQAGLTATERSYGECGVVANFACDLPHRNIARQWFQPDGVLAWLPLAGQRISIVWSVAEARAPALCELPARQLADQVAAAGQHALGRLEVITPAAAFPLRLLRVPRIVAPRVALVGDAAHGIHPLSGHGINLGFRDAEALAGVLAAANDWEDVGNLRLLSRYQRERAEEVLLMQATTDGLRRLFDSRWPGVTPLRNLGLRMTNALPIVKSALVRYALGSL